MLAMIACAYASFGGGGGGGGGLNLGALLQQVNKFELLKIYEKEKNREEKETKRK